MKQSQKIAGSGTAQTVSRLLENVVQGRPPCRDDLVRLLGLEGDERDELFACARAQRQRFFGDAVFLYGFIYLSTYCRNDCAFCQYRHSATTIRYRKSRDEIVAAGRQLAADGVHLLDLTLGEDPAYLDAQGFAALLDTVGELRETGLPIMLSPGVLDDTQLDLLVRAGVDWYACYQETHNQELFAHLRPGQAYDRRLHARRRAAELGIHTEEGILVGVGATLEDLADSVLHMHQEPLRQVRAMTYVPHETTLASVPGALGTYGQELNLIAVMRLYMPERLIPASLDVDGLDGLHSRLDAGANVVTSMIPSGYGFAGVVSEHLDIENHRRGMPAVLDVLKEHGLCAATPEAYRNWLARKKPTEGLCE